MIAPLRQQFTNFWQHQSNPRRMALVGLVVAILILVPLFLTWASTPTYTVAFSGLSEADAGQIVQKMTEDGTPYRLRDSGTIMVPSDKVYEVRLQMATEGLPQSGTVGFELFSGNTLGMTEFTQRVNYQRALEGELERTISSMAAVAAVRVHVVTPEKTLLAGDQPPATASVTVQERPGRRLDEGQVQSITHLLASSVENLTPENVVVVDTNGNMLAAGSGDGESASSLAQSDSQRSAEMSAALSMQKKVQGLLDSVLGPNRSVVQASVVMDWTKRETTTQSFTPDPTAVRSSQKVNETYTTDGAIIGGIPGAATNLPTPVPTTTAVSGNTIYSREEETLNYEMSQVESHEIETPGQVERVSLSVLVDGVTDAQQLSTLKSAVAAAVGIDEVRGDTLAVESLAFDRSFYEDQTAELQKSGQMNLYVQIGQYVLLGLVVILLLWYVSRLFRNLRLASSEAWTPVLKPVAEMAALPGMNSMSTGSMMTQSLPMGSESPIQLPTVEQLMPEMAARMHAQVPNPEDEQMQRVVARLAEESPANVAEIIQLWLSEDEK